eukprot:704940-Pyramimonas_sp.AAC.2
MGTSKGTTIATLESAEDISAGTRSPAGLTTTRALGEGTPNACPEGEKWPVGVFSVGLGGWLGDAP